MKIGKFETQTKGLQFLFSVLLGEAHRGFFRDRSTLDLFLREVEEWDSSYWRKACKGDEDVGEFFECLLNPIAKFLSSVADAGLGEDAGVFHSLEVDKATKRIKGVAGCIDLATPGLDELGDGKKRFRFRMVFHAKGECEVFFCHANEWPHVPVEATSLSSQEEALVEEEWAKKAQEAPYRA